VTFVFGRQLCLGEVTKYLGIAQTTVIKCHTLLSSHRYFDEGNLLDFLIGFVKQHPITEPNH